MSVKARNLNKEESNNLFNRLKSIEHDEQFVLEFSSLFPHLPLVANKRCGSWYCPNYNDTSYYKSTDGHSRNWQFSFQRLNLHIAELASKAGGCIIVDSTRKGKQYPDSFSRTIPIWCGVINRSVATLHRQANQNYPIGPQWTDLKILGATELEKDEISNSLNVIAQKLLESGANIHQIAEVMKKPLCPLWFNPASVLWPSLGIDVPDYSQLGFTPIICLQASSYVETYHQDYFYIQGAGDDEETWAKGLTPQLFWAQRSFLLEDKNKTDDRLELLLKGTEKIEEIPLKFHGIPERTLSNFYTIGNTGITLGNGMNGLDQIGKDYDAVLNCSIENYQAKYFPSSSHEEEAANYLHSAYNREICGVYQTHLR